MLETTQRPIKRAYDEWPAPPDKPPLHLRGGYLCVAAPLSLTEACFSVPAVRALRNSRPQSTISIVCTESQAALWELMPQVNHVISYPEKSSARQISAIMKAQKVTFESSIAWEAGEAAKAFKRVNILQRLGYPAAKLISSLTDEVDVVTVIGPITHRVRYYLDLVDRLTEKAYVAASFKTGYKDKEILGNKVTIGLVTESSYGLSYQWPQENFTEMKCSMEKVYGKYNIEWVDISQKAQVAESLDILRGCHVLLACDSETAHLAAHLGLPAIVLFGPNAPEWKRPLGKQSKVICEYAACSPCYLSRCPIDLRCQSSISIDRVVQELGKVLEGIQKVLGSADAETV